MRGSKRLEPVVKLAGRRERDAAALLREQRRLLDAVERRRAQLEQYRAEYAGGNGSGEARAAHELKDRQRFLATLDKAIEGAQQQARRARESYERDRSGWHAAHSRVRAVQSLIERRESEERREIERRQETDTEERIHAAAHAKAREPER